ncbi:MAG TPA: hypothetical protein PKD74_02900 [Candidatus Dependentiae bacterium]|jgi:hypothetical protein|nr:hypothetical protein [Candidatus Dependentiae bacterium]
MKQFSCAHKGLLSLCALLSINAYATQQVAVTRNADGYNVIHNGQCHEVKPYDTDSLLRMMNPSQLQSFVNAGGSIRVHQLSNGDYMLRSFVPGKGGGGLLGAAVALGGSLLTAAAAAGAAVGGFAVGGPAGAAAAAVITVKAGMAATVYATIAATATPTP